jgi:hypothetical protein
VRSEELGVWFGSNAAEPVKPNGHSLSAIEPIATILLQRCE